MNIYFNGSNGISDGGLGARSGVPPRPGVYRLIREMCFFDKKDNYFAILITKSTKYMCISCL
jgi:hypothetical protein